MKEKIATLEKVIDDFSRVDMKADISASSITKDLEVFLSQNAQGLVDSGSSSDEKVLAAKGYCLISIIKIFEY